MKPGTLVKLKKDYLHYHTTTIGTNSSLMVKAEDILLFIKWDLTSREDQADGILLFRETLIYADTYIFEALNE